MLLECNNPNWIGDGYCDDVTNTMECNYDGGDCCLDPVNIQYCSECQCLDGGSGTTINPATTNSPTTPTSSGILKYTAKNNNKILLSCF